MEEIKNSKEKPQLIELGTKEPSYDDLKAAVFTWQQRATALENRLRSIDMVAARLEYLFRVLDSKDVLPKEFVDKCAKEIVEILTIDTEKPTE